MRSYALVVFAAIAAVPFAACGSGPTTPPAASPGSGTGGADASMAQASGSGEASSTTTQTLGGSGDLDAGPLPEVAAPVGSFVTDAGAMVIVGDGGSARSRDDSMAAVLARRPQARACYDAGRKQHPELSGKLNITFVIDPKGNVVDGQVGANSDISDPGVVSCIVALIKAIPFGPNANGRNTIVTYPFKFTPNGG